VRFEHEIGITDNCSRFEAKSLFVFGKGELLKNWYLNK
jgi:hypothetical protein